MKALRWVWGYIRPYRVRIFCGLMFLLVLDSIFLIWPFFTGGIVDNVINDGFTELGYTNRMSLLKLYLAGMFGVIIIKSIARYSFHILMEKSSILVLIDIKNSLYKHMQKLDFKFFNSNRTGDIMTRMSSDLDVIRHFTVWVIPMVLENIIVFAGVIIILLFNNIYLTLAMLTVTPFIAILAFKLAYTVRPVYSAVREAYSKLNTVVQENISGNRIVKAFAREDFEESKFIKENENYRKTALKAARIWAKFLPWLDTLSGSLTIIVILIGGILVIRGKLTVGQLVVFNGLVWALNMPMRVMCNIVNDMQKFFASTEQVMWLFDAEPDIDDRHVTKDFADFEASGFTREEASDNASDNAIDNMPDTLLDIDSSCDEQVPCKIDNEPEIKIKGEIEFCDAGFTYGGDTILKDISFHVLPGELVCIMGPTGSGKSTLVSLIGRFYDCTAGEILLDGRNIKNIELSRVRKSVSYAMQDVFLFSDTVEGNISYGVPDAPIKDIEDAAVVADAEEFIRKMEDGYDTIIGERGVGLSGGQRQRIALARALVMPSPIIVLDDTTSSVDIETEYSINSKMRKMHGSRTTFMITHRISSASRADRIIVMIDGRIAEMGTHKTLIDKKGYYYDIFKQQYEDYDEIIGDVR